MDDIVIATVRKNQREEFRVLLREFKERRFVDLRLFAVNGEGQPTPTRTGAAIRPELLRPVIEALEAAEREARAQGMLP